MQIETIETSSFAMDYFKFGKGKETLAIIPGLSVQSVMGFADDIANAYRLLADVFTIYVFDRRKELPAAYPVRAMARDTADAFRALGLRNVSVMGASQGGMIALSMAIGQPDLVKKLVLCSTAARMTNERYRKVEEWVQLAKAGNATGLYLAFGKALYPQDVFEGSRELLIGAAESVTADDLDRFVILAEGAKGFDAAGELGRIACPVLLVGSADDRVLGADATLEIAERLGARPGFALHMYDGYGHAAYDTAPDLKERMLRFLAPVYSTPAS